MKITPSTHRIIGLLVLLWFTSTELIAQLPKIRLTDSYNGITWNELLPSGQDFLITGPVTEQIGGVEVKIFRGGSLRTGAPIFEGEWTRSRRKQTDEFSIPVRYSLTPGVAYDLQFRFLRPPNNLDLDELMEVQRGKVAGYIKAASQSAKYKPLDQKLKSPGKRVRELNEIFLASLKDIKGVEASDFRGYSHRVKTGFSQMNFFAKTYQEQLGYGDLFKALVEQAEFVLEDHTRYLTELAVDESEGFVYRKLMVEDKTTAIERHKAAEMVIAGHLPKPVRTKVKRPKSPKPPKVKKAKEPKVAKVKAPKEPKVKAPKESKVKEPKVKEPKETKVKEPKEPKVKEPKETKVKEPKEPKVKEPKETKETKAKEPKEPKVKEPKETKAKEPKVKEPKVKEPVAESDHPYWHGISLNVGLGAVHLNKFSDGRSNASFGGSSFVGFSFPLAHHITGPRFLRRSSATFGAFLSDLKDEDDQVFSGSIFRTPMYFAFGHRVFQVLRFHLGVSVLKTPVGLTEKSALIVRPMGGISLDLNWELFERFKRDF